jgi:hypothetical protein
MYILSRFFVTLGILALAYSCIVLVVAIWPWSLLVVAAAAVRFTAKRLPNLTAHGTARVSDEHELRKARMVGARSGLILGRVSPKPKGRWLRAVAGVLNNKVPAEDACRRFFEVLRTRAAQDKGELVRMPQAVHTAVFAPTRSGKGVSCILPFIYTTEESFVCIDPKGENAMLTFEHLRRKGFEIVILDPHKVVTQ